MNYRHAFHAGNFADVFKHTILIELLEHLRAKPTPFCYIDTHAGRGEYDLTGDMATRTGEAAAGIGRVQDAGALPPALDAYRTAVRAFNVDDALSRYPGSPLLARMRLRENDRAIVCELQPDEAAALRSAMRGDARIAVHERDGYAALKALLPPAQKRGLVLIDPPFEAQGAEYARIEEALGDAFERWPNAIHATWYPIKLRETVVPFHRWLVGNAARRDVLVAELLLYPDDSPLRLAGCGVAIVNAPWQFDRRLQTWLPALAALLADGASRAAYRIDWLQRS